MTPKENKVLRHAAAATLAAMVSTSSDPGPLEALIKDGDPLVRAQGVITWLVVAENTAAKRLESIASSDPDPDVCICSLHLSFVSVICLGPGLKADWGSGRCVYVGPVLNVKNGRKTCLFIVF